MTHPSFMDYKCVKYYPDPTLQWTLPWTMAQTWIFGICALWPWPWRYDLTIVIMRCPSSVRPSSLTFHIFDFSTETVERNLTKLYRKLDPNVLYQVCVLGPIGKTGWPPWPLIGCDIFDFSETAERNSWKLDRKQDPNVLYQVCVFFSGGSKKQDGRPGLWLAETFSTYLKTLNEIHRNLTGSKISTSSTKFVFFGRIGKTRWPPWPLIGWGIFDFSSETAERNSTKLDKKKDFNVLYHVCFSGPIGKTRWPPRPLIGWDIFDFSSETTERNSTKPDRKQDLNVFYLVCVSLANWQNKMAALASDLLRHFRLIWKRWMKFIETWQEARSQRLLPSLFFSGGSEKQDGRPGLWLAETFSTSLLKPLNGIQRNLTGRKILTSSTKFVFFGSIGKTRWLPLPLIGWDIFDFSSETTERNSTKLDRKQDLNVFYLVCVSLANWQNKMAVLASDLLRHFRLLLWNRWTGFNETWQGRKISTSSTKFVFFLPIGKTRWPPWPIRQKGGILYSGVW